MARIKDFFIFIYHWVVGTKKITQATEPVPPTPEPIKRKYKKRQAFYVDPNGDTNTFPQTFSELLDNLGDMFTKMQLPVAGSWLSADERVGLTRLGVYLPHPWVMDNPAVITTPRVKTLGKFPSVMCVAYPQQGQKEDGMTSPHIMFAIKTNKLPLGVQRIEGVPYKAGVAVEVDKKVFWFYMWAVVDEHTGNVSFCRELRLKPCETRRDIRYMQRVSDVPAILEKDPYVEMLQATREHVYKVLFAQMFNWWVDRKDKSWNVAAKIKKQRITFCVNRNETKRYFADRDKKIVSTTGKPKKIIHYVAEHERVVNGKIITVKEHLRGESNFTWNGYTCMVTAPKFSPLVTVDFDISAEDSDEVLRTGGYVGLSKLSQIIVNEEERVHSRKQLVSSQAA